MFFLLKVKIRTKKASELFRSYHPYTHKVRQFVFIISLYYFELELILLETRHLGFIFSGYRC